MSMEEAPINSTGGCLQMAANLTEPRESRLFRAPRCQARAKSTGQACKCPAVRGKQVCKVHGGARGSGAPSGERNGSWKHGAWSHEAIGIRREAAALLKAIREAEGVCIGVPAIADPRYTPND